MIALVKSCSGVKELCEYVMGEGKGYELDRGLLCGKNAEEIIEEFKLLQDQNRKANRKTFSIVLSPHPKDGAVLSDNELKEISKSFMQKMGIDPDTAQYLSFIHTNTEQKHIHLIVSRIRIDSTLINGNFTGYRGMAAAHEIAIERGLMSAKSLHLESIELHSPMLDENWRIKKEILLIFKKTVSQNVDSLEDFAGKMFAQGLQVKFVENRKGELQGYRIFDEKTQMSFKASEINSKLQLKSLFSSGIYPLENRKLSPVLRKSLSYAMAGQVLKGVKKLERETQKDRENDR